jgi:Zn-dependent metalloprotease
MKTITQYPCGVIPPHILDRIGAHSRSVDARSTLEQMRDAASIRMLALLDHQLPPEAFPVRRKKCAVFDARGGHKLPGKLVMDGHRSYKPDLAARQAWSGAVATWDFFAEVFGRRSIDGRGCRLIATVHYGQQFANAMWNGEQMVYGDGDGRVITSFTACPVVIGHELVHGYTQHIRGLSYFGQTGAVNESFSDVFGVMASHWARGVKVHDADWTVGAGLFAPGINARGVRSLSDPGSAYDDPILGRDPQPRHMRDYVDTPEDNGGVHINSGIPNLAFYRVAMAFGGHSWGPAGKIWYTALTYRLTNDAQFDDLALATFDVAGDLYGFGGRFQKIVAEAWDSVGLPCY